MKRSPAVQGIKGQTGLGHSGEAKMLRSRRDDHDNDISTRRYVRKYGFMTKARWNVCTTSVSNSIQ